jgi:formamidopyrimidine-DNA glycosylase
MPELPEVEVAARNLRRWAVGRQVRAVDAEASRVLRPGGPRALARVVGARVRSVDRIGKNLLVTLARSKADRVSGGRLRRPELGAGGAEPSEGPDQIGIWSHLGMTGKWLRREAGAPVPRFSRARFTLDDGSVLHYADMRLFGRLRVVPGARFDQLPDLRALGPDPLRDGIDARRLWEKLARTRVPLKVALLDQRLLAGIGNIQANEGCFRARLDPRRPASSLTRAEANRLARGLLATIRYSLRRFEADGVTADRADIAYVEEPKTPNPFLVYARAGERCSRRDGGIIQRVVQAQRSTFFCPRCQK